MDRWMEMCTEGWRRSLQSHLLGLLGGGIGKQGGSFRPYPPLPRSLAGGLTARWVATSSVSGVSSLRDSCSSKYVSVGTLRFATSWASWGRLTKRHLLEDALLREQAAASVAAGLAPRVGRRAPAPCSTASVGALIGEAKGRLPLPRLHGAAAAQTTKNSNRELIAV